MVALGRLQLMLLVAVDQVKYLHPFQGVEALLKIFVKDIIRALMELRSSIVNG